MKDKISARKLHKWVKNNFSKIDSGKITPYNFIGSHLKTDEIVENAKMHDAYTALYKEFFKELYIKRNECAVNVRENMIENFLQYDDGLNLRERRMLKSAFSNFKKRPPISIEQQVLKGLIDVMHESAANCCGHSVADTILSNAAKTVNANSNTYDVYKFL